MENDDSVGKLGSVAGLWAMKHALLTPASSSSSATRSADGDAAKAIVEDHLSPGILVSRYVPDFVQDCMRRGFAATAAVSSSAWTATSSVWTHERTGVRIRQCSASPSSRSPREDHDALRGVMEFILEFMWYLREHGGPASSAAAFPRELVVSTLACDVPRTFPARRGDPLGPRHLNGGVCTFTSRDVRHVLVYRAQHMPKVLMHELVHACGVGSAVSGSSSVVLAERDVMRELRYASASGGLHADEAFTEILACHAHMFWRATGKARARDDLRGAVFEEWLKDTLYVMWDAERRLYLGVCRAVADHFRPALMREDTHVMSYLFAKAALWDSCLDRVPAVIVREREAERFADLYRRRLLANDFWSTIRDFPASEIPSTPLMTGL